MSNLNLSGQGIEKQSIAPKLLRLKSLLDERKVIWDKIAIGIKIKWVKSGKDPIADIAWDIYKYLYKFFDGYDPNGND